MPSVNYIAPLIQSSSLPSTKVQDKSQDQVPLPWSSQQAVVLLRDVSCRGSLQLLTLTLPSGVGQLDDGPSALATAGGATLGTAALVSIVALLSAILLA